MAVFAQSDLKKWRGQQGISQADLAEIVACDTSTIQRYEAGKIKMNPDVAYQICEALGDTSVWCSWMRTEYPTSYARVHPEPVRYDLPGVLCSLFATIGKLSKLQNDVLQDGADGHIDDQDLAHALSEGITELDRSTQRLSTMLCDSNHQKGV